MKVYGDANPGTLRVEDYPPKPGLSLVRFFENAKERIQQVGDYTTKYWEYDEYQLIMPRTTKEDIEANLEMFLTQAKLAEQTPEKKLETNSRLLEILLGA